MNSSEWERHKGEWCERCRHNSKRKPCVAIRYMDSDPTDYQVTHFVKLPRCTQYEQRPQRKGKAKERGKDETSKAKRKS